MSIRAGAFGDIPRVCAIIEEAHLASIYAGLTFDAQEARKLVLSAMQRVGRKGEGGAFVAMAEHDGAVTGFIMGVLQRVYHVHQELMATDLFFIVPGGDPKDAVKLLRVFKKWAWSCPGVVQVECAATGAMGDRWPTTGRWLRRSGMIPYGAIYREARA